MTRSPLPGCLARFAIGLILLCAPAVLPAQNSGGVQTAIPLGGFRVSGIVANKIGGHPLAGARVVVADTRNRENVVSMVTTEDGRFTFHVPAGKYSLSAEKRGFLTTSYKGHEEFSTAIVTGAGFDTESLVIHLAPNAVLSGKVFDESGEPVRNASVTVFREDHGSGIGLIQAISQSNTDDQGTYEVTSLGDGTYFVSAHAKPWYAVHPVSSRGGEVAVPSTVGPSLDVAYPVTYYADATESDDATPIPIRGGDRVEADVHLVPVPALHLFVHVAGGESRGFEMPMFQKQSFDEMAQVEVGGANMVSPGVFEITGIPAGRYAVGVAGFRGAAVNEPSEVDLTSNTPELDMASGNPTSTVKAKVQVVGELKLPTPLRVAMRNRKGRVAAVREVNAEGEATFPNISTGEYSFLAGSPNQAYTAKVASTSGVTAGRKLNVPPGSSLDITLSLIGGQVTVEGVAQRSGKPFPGAMVVLVPKDPESKREFFRRDQSDMDGTFSLPQVFPGAYTVIAIEDGWDLDWGKPAVLEQYTKRGQSITVASQAKGEAQLPDAVEVQPK
jgi:hypothetical protein